MNRFTRLALAVIAGVIVGGGISYAAFSSSNRSSPSVRTSVASGLRRHFSVFARPRKNHFRAAGHIADTAAPSLPTQVADSFNDPAQAGANYEPNASEAVYEKPDSESSFGFWIVPGHRGACVVWQTTAIWPSAHANCARLSDIEKGGMTEISSADGPELLFGFVPNGAASVTVTNADGSTISAAVVNNAYLVVDSQKTAHSLTIQNGTTGTIIKPISD